METKDVYYSVEWWGETREVIASLIGSGLTMRMKPYRSSYMT